MTVTYQVGGGGHLDVDFTMRGPGDKLMTEILKKDTGTYSFTAESDGRFNYCFSNEMSTVTGKTIRSVRVTIAHCNRQGTCAHVL